jgi:hypothetical protein
MSKYTSIRQLENGTFQVIEYGTSPFKINDLIKKPISSWGAAIQNCIVCTDNVK